MKIFYFAYGSNMSTEWLHARIPSARTVGPAYIENKAVCFNMQDIDGSGKANLLDSAGDVTWGVLYEITVENDYIRTLSSVLTPEGDSVIAEMYIATKFTDEPVASEWYKDLLITSAQEHNLPENILSI